ncbi:SET domain-containing protein [Dichomitus squalens]|uniref:SET domain-containing protein n=1 Tax=Dichomitus squalens TaxID=114155 RepID=A0A4Q9PC18_9APHY|nr:SET domain-containing protein [Dichomitus squalens]TBU52320.1 SET domain-containing protein [Dichomitus squalens]
MTRKTPSVVKETFREVWYDYYAWEPTYCSRKLTSLRANMGLPAVHSISDSDLTDPNHPAEDGIPTRNMSITDSETSFTRYTVNESIQLHTAIVDADTTTITMTLTPYPPYESCTPASRNILHGDDPNYLPFVPFADDPTFDPTEYVYDHKGLAWQEAYRDSDVLEIVLETARRVHFQRGVSIEHIDATGILPLELRTTSVWGAIWTGRMSDPMPWHRSSRSLYPPLPDLSPPPRHDLRVRLQDYMTLWCPHVDCMEANCLSHASEQFEIDLSQPRSSGEEQFKLLSNALPCSPECQMNGPTNHEDEIRWTDEELGELQVICYAAPPTTPCALARLCRKPCREVAVLCSKFIRTAVEDDGADDHQMLNPIFGDETAPNFVPNAPCAHTGPCSPDTGCACSLNNAHCASACRCAKTCARRWKGCHCPSLVVKSYKKHKKDKVIPACSTDLCPCRKARRECDPEVCSPCRKSCRNLQIQQCLSKSVSVRQSDHGLGLFLDEDVKEGDLVAEYVGELIYEPTFQCRSQLAEHIGRSYVFGLNTQISVDSTYAGNPARYINHAPYRKANLEVMILFVHGEQRIGIFAKKSIARGTELFLDYGPEFPIQHGEKRKTP